jgi:hypothetical protein
MTRRRCSVMFTAPRLTTPSSGVGTGRKSGPQITSATPSRKKRTPSAAIIACTGVLPSSGRKTTRSIAAPRSATTATAATTATTYG